MFSTINKQFAAAKRSRKEDRFILESVLGEETEILPGSEDELEEMIDPDSVPDDAYKKVDALLDRIVASGKYDDTEAEELLDDDIDENEIDDATLNMLIDEGAAEWLADCAA